MSTPNDVSIAALPQLGQPLGDGTFAGLATTPDGKHYAIEWLNTIHMAEPLPFDDTVAWAKNIGVQLASRAVMSVIFANVRSMLQEESVWTSDEYEGDETYAWVCNLRDGDLNGIHRSNKHGALCVRLRPLTT